MAPAKEVAAAGQIPHIARELHVPVCSFSVLPKQASFAELRKKARKVGRIRLVVSTACYSLTASNGGLFHDVIHPLDMLLRLSGCAVSHVQVVRGSGKTLTATLSYRDGTAATTDLVPRVPLHLAVIGEKGRADQPIDYDEDVYLTGISEFCRMFRTGKTKETQQTILGPIAVLEAMEKSLAVGRRIRVSAF